jgi:hypothetical protein
MLSQNREENIEPVISKLKGEDTATVHNWDLEKAKAWLESSEGSLLIFNSASCDRTKEHVSAVLLHALRHCNGVY